MKLCPYCAEEIQDSAVKCRFCGEWLTTDVRRAGNASSEHRTDAPAIATSTVTDAGGERIEPQSTARPQEANPKLKGFGGWLMVFLLMQFMPLAQFVGQYGEQALLEHPFIAGWLALGIVLGFALLYEGHRTPVRLVMLYLVANLALGVVEVWYATQSSAASVGTIIGASIPSFLWLLYFMISKRVRATYYGAEPAIITPQVKRRHRRIIFILAGLIALSVVVLIGTWLVLTPSRQSLSFFFSPTQIATKQAPVGQTFRIGGLVQNETLKRDTDGLTIRFTLTDTANTIPVVYKGILPDLFKEGRGCVAQGHVGSDGVFYADQIMAKHDENYRPPDVRNSDKVKDSANEAAKTLAK